MSFGDLQCLISRVYFYKIVLAPQMCTLPPPAFYTHRETCIKHVVSSIVGLCGREYKMWLQALPESLAHQTLHVTKSSTLRSRNSRCIIGLELLAAPILLSLVIWFFFLRSKHARLPLWALPRTFPSMMLQFTCSLLGTNIQADKLQSTVTQSDKMFSGEKEVRVHPNPMCDTGLWSSSECLQSVELLHFWVS